MPPVAPHDPVDVTDPRGTRFRVHDELYGPPHCAAHEARAVPPGSTADAAHRVFVREGDGVRVSVALIRDDYARFDAASLAEQLAMAMAGGRSLVQAPGAPPWRVLQEQWIAEQSTRANPADRR